MSDDALSILVFLGMPYALIAGLVFAVNYDEMKMSWHSREKTRYARWALAAPLWPVTGIVVFLVSLYKVLGEAVRNAR